MVADQSWLIPPDVRASERGGVRFPDGAMTHAELCAAAAGSPVGDARRVAVWAEPRLETCIALVGALRAGAAVVPINPKLGPRELEHVIADSEPDLLLARPDADLPAELERVRRVAVSRDGGAEDSAPPRPDPESDALIMYTSGTTGPPKGVVLSRRAVASNLDALAKCWAWTSADVLVHGLPMFHAHGLVLGTLGPLRLGGWLHHVGRFSIDAVCAELSAGATMLFAVPTMYHRLAAAAESEPEIAAALGRARLLVSGSAALPARDHARIEALTGRRIVERYGLTETLMNCAGRADGPRTAGAVGPPLPGVEVRLVDDGGTVVGGAGEDVMGEIQVRGPNLFTRYLHLPKETAAAFTEGGWFKTGDIASRTAAGELKIVGRRSTDIIKTGGYKVGAGEVEAALAEHPLVAEVAVTGRPDEDLGERIVAWVVLASGAVADERGLSEHVAARLTPHKRPRAVHFVEALPRNPLGKVLKRELGRPAVAFGAVVPLGTAAPHLGPDVWIATGASVVGDVELGARTSVWYGAVLRADNDRITVGRESNLQDGCVLHADVGEPTVLGDRVTVGHRAIVHGARVESDSLIGMGAMVLNGVHIGSGSIVAAGAVVVGNQAIPPGSLLVGVPAKVRRAVTDAERQEIADTAAEYVALARRHRETGTTTPRGGRERNREGT